MRLLQLTAIIGMVVILSGCVNQARLVFQCAENINEGLLLPVDVILVSQQEEKGVVLIGPEAWFESEYRNAMSKEQLIKRAFKGGETTEIVIKPQQKKKDIVVIIFADYMNISEQEPQQIIIRSHQYRKEIRIKVEGNGLRMIK